MKATLVRNAALIALALAASGPALPDAGETTPAAPALARNLLLVTIDTLRPDRLSPYDKYNAQTPAAAGLAARGSLFEAAYANSPITLPSHAGIMLGTPPPVHGVSENSHTRVPDGPPTLAEEMKASGRETAAFVGAFPLDSRFGLDRGFDLYDDKFPARPSSLSTFSERRADKVVAAASAWLAARKGPWFCWVHLWDPHTPYDPPPPFRDKYKNDPYSGEAAYADSELGKLLDGLAASGTLDNTFVVLTSDHGESLGEHGELTHSYFAYDSTLRVPLIIAGPGLRPLRIKEPVSHIDLLPTVCDLLGLQAPAGLPGRSLAPALQGKALSQRPIYIEAMDAALNKGCAPLRGLIDRGRKYLESPIPELYDLSKDPGETSNLAGSTDLAPYKKAFRDYLASLPRASAPGTQRPLDAAARSRLLSLGYVTASGTPLKASYGPEDDVKTFQPLQHDLEAAILLLDRGQSDESLAGLQALIRKRPDFIPAYTVTTQLHLLQGRPREALLVMREAYLKNPENYTVLSSFGTLLVQEGQWESAVEVISKALAKKDFDPEAWNNLGFAWWKKGDVVKALEYMHKAEVLDPTFAPAPSHMGAVFQYLYYAQGRKPDDLRRSIDYFRRAGEIDPTFNLAFRGLGVSLKEDGRTAEAEAAWSKALQADPNDLFSLLARGEARLLLGRKAEARADLERFLTASGSRITAEEKARVQALLEQAKR